VYFFIYGDPITKMKSKLMLTDYLAETYPDDEFYISKATYDPEFSNFLYDVVIKDDPSGKEYQFEVPGLFSEYELHDGIFYANLDVELGNIFENEAIEEIKSDLKDIAPEIRELEVDIYVLKGKYDTDQTWSKDLDMDKPMFIQMIIDGEGLSKQEVFEVTQAIQKKLNDEGYDYEKVAVNVYVPFKNDWLDEWIVKYMVDFDPKTMLTETDIEDHNTDMFEEQT